MTIDSKKPCLVWICRGDERYGIESAMVNFSNSLQSRGWAIVIIGLNEGSFIQKCRDSDWHLITLETPEIPKAITGSIFKRVNSWRRTQKITRLLSNAILDCELPDSCDIKVVQTFNIFLLEPVSKLAKKHNSQAIWRMPHNVRRRRPINYVRILMQYRLWSNSVLAMGTSAFTTQSLGYGPALVTTNAHGSDISKFRHNSLNSYERSTFSIPEKAVVFIIAAQLYGDDNKGQLTFATALANVSKIVPDLHLMLLGGPSDGILADRIRKVSENADMKVHFTGVVTDVENYYSLSNVAVSSRLTPEPFGLSVIEAMLMGKPVLAHASGGPAETVLDSITGWHAKQASVAEFEKTIRRCLDDKSEWKTMGEKAKNIALEKYSVDAEVTRWLTELKFPETDY